MQTFYSAGVSGEWLMRQGGQEFTKIENVPLHITCFESCGYYNIFYSSDGDWHGGGANSFFQQGHGRKNIQPFTKLEAFSGHKPKIISCGEKISAFLTAEGELYVTGTKYKTCTKILEIPPLSIISCGVDKIVAIPQEQTGIFVISSPSNIDVYQPDKYFVDCAVGHDFFLALDDSGIAYSWGNSVAVGHGSIRTTTPFELKTIKNRITKVFARYDQSILVGENNTLYVAGQNEANQLGIRSKSEIDSFIQIPIDFTQNSIEKITFSEKVTFILDSEGKVFTSSNENSNCLFESFQNKMHSKKSTFKKIILPENLIVSNISAGACHIIFATNFGIHGKDAFVIYLKNISHAPVYRKILCKNEFEESIVDVSDAAFAYLGFEKENCIIESKATNLAQIIGIIDQNTVVLRQLKTGFYIKLYFQHPLILHKTFQIKFNYSNNSQINENNNNNKINKNKLNYDHNENENHHENKEIDNLNNSDFKENNCNENDWILKKTRSGLNLMFNQSDKACRVFGFLSGERVKHELIGEGTVIGVFGNNLWFLWDNDQDCVTNCNMNPISMHNIIEIIQPKGRTLDSFYLEEQNSIISIETEPCNVLKRYGFKVKDFVLYRGTLCQIFGEFGFNVAVQFTNNNKYEIVLPNSLQLVRRENLDSEELTIVEMKSFNGKIVEVDVGFNESIDKLIPLDRILTKKGFATVVGKEVCDSGQKGFWIQTDDAFVLNLGINLMKASLNQVKLLRRFSENEKRENDLIVSFSPFNNFDVSIYSGDVVIKNNKIMLVVGLNDHSNPVFCELKDDMLHEIHQNIFENENEIKVIYRAGISTSLNFMIKNRMSIAAHVDVDHFQGIGFKAGDIISTPHGESIVIGILNDKIFVKNKNQDQPTIIRAKDAYNRNLFYAVKRLGVGLDLL